ncbi:hypothetical protein DPMN_137348 [Dreissena polymorpha]|jgi:hypothetical protein|uniref:Uncharacterized protein n=2 Tax=Dreissena polymorpha TaxID=45954 RepID=A0A9D4JDJ8_DREPO|nr:hypothetical protein DPMN_137348 [Dreissena polymorpha]
MSRLGNILDMDLVLDDSDVSKSWRRCYPRFEPRRLNRRLTDESTTVGEFFRGRPQEIDSHSVINISAVHLNITKRYYIINSNLFRRVGVVSQSKLFRKKNELRETRAYVPY